MSEYKALVFDIDGTAVTNSRDAVPSPRLVQAIKSAHGHLELFAATGRSIPYSRPVLKTLWLTQPCIIGGGTTLMDPSTGEVINQSLLNHETMGLVQAAMKPLPYDVQLPSTSESFQARTNGLKITALQPYLLVSQVTPADITRVLLALSHVPGVVAATSPDWEGGHYVQITDADATKEHRIRQLLGQLGITKDQAIGVGDADNDIHLFAAVGHRVAMGNATDQLKAIADEIAPSVEEDGLAHIIERYT